MNTDKDSTSSLAAMDRLPIGSALIKNIIPAILAMLMMLVYNMADKVFVAMANNDYMVAGVTLVSPIFLVFMAAGNIFGTGGVALMSRYAGTGEEKKADNVSSFCFWSALVLGVIVGILLLAFRAPILSLLGAKGGDTYAYASDYYTYIVMSAPFAILSPTLASLLRAEGKPGLSTAGSVIGNLTNIVLDPIFILGFHTGTKGAAIATALGNVVAVVCYLLFIFTKKSRTSIRLSDFAWKEKIASSVYSIGIAAAIATIGQTVCQVLMNNKMSDYGDMPVAGLGAAYNIVTIVMVFALGIGQGCQPLLGYQVGNQNKAKFKQILKYCYISLLVVCAILTALCYIFMEPLARIFVSGDEAVAYGVAFGKIVTSTAWAYGIFQVSSQIIQIMGSATAALVVSLSKNAYVFIPCLYICAAIGGMYGIAWCIPASDVISAVIAVMVMGYNLKKSFPDEEKAK